MKLHAFLTSELDWGKWSV